MANIYTSERGYYNTSDTLRKKILRRFSMFDGVGLDLTNAETYDEALEAAGIDYTAEKQPIYLADGTEIKDNFASVKSDKPGVVLGIVGNQYSPVASREAFAVAEDIVNGGYARYEVGGPCRGSKNALDYSKTFLVLRHDDIEINDDVYNTFTVLNNSFDGSSGVQYQTICQRVVCMNGMVRMLGGKKSQLRVTIQHTKSASERIRLSREIVMHRAEEIKEIENEARLFINTGMTKEQYQQLIIPLVLKERKIVENDKERERGQERIDNMVAQLMTAYDAEDTQNYNGTAYKAILALSDWETHADPLRNTGNGQVYMNRILKGMVTTSAVAAFIAQMPGFGRNKQY